MSIYKTSTLMFFNSIEFACFLPIVFCFYWYIFNKNLTIQNSFLLLSSYFFYACWDWRFLFLLIFSTSLDFFTALQITKTNKQMHRRFWFWLSIIINVGFLGVFKYYDFFAISLASAMSHVGVVLDPFTLKVILPVGISFYTFHGLSYIIDVYKGRIDAEKNVVDYSVFVSFFPLLVAGPIERATHLLPQIKKTRVFNYASAVDGLKQILWGLFKKIVIADQCANYANMTFSHPQEHTGSSLLLGAIFFSIQIYGDFSGYSDIAIGTAKLFGIDLLKNFAFPYFSRDIAEFWRRWHISLSSWFKDYLYIPLGGSRGSVWLKIRNTFIIFIVCGFWHGANWTFIFWGFLNALYMVPLVISKKNRKYLDVVAKGRFFPNLREFFAMGTTFGLTVFAWIFFRAESMTRAIHYIEKIFSVSLFSRPGLKFSIYFYSLVIGFFIIEWLGRNEEYALANISLGKIPILRYALYYALIISIFWFGGEVHQFIYFQF